MADETVSTPPTNSDLHFTGSAFEQAKLYATETGLSTETAEPKPMELEPEDVQIILEMPFDAAAFATKYDGFALEDAESRRLARLFVKPLARLGVKIKDFDLYLATLNLGAVALEKYAEYRIWRDDCARAERERQDQLPKAAIQ
jgi:hypothetical protein